MTEAARHSQQQQQQLEPEDEELDPHEDEDMGTDASGRTIVVDPNPMNEIMKRAEQLRNETSDGVVYPCEYCQKVFKFKYEHERHAKIHSGDRPWQCPECMKTFSRKDNMRAHMKIHTGELVRHICQLCGKSYGRKYDLQVHERVHTGERPFECGSCGKSFISTSRLRAHQLIHCKNIYLPRHVRNKKLHLMKRRAAAAREDSDSPTDSVDGGCSPAGVEDDDEDYDEEDELDRDETEESEEAAQTDSRESASLTVANKRQELLLVRPEQHEKLQRLASQPSISLVKAPARHISISLVKSCRQELSKVSRIDDPQSQASPEVLSTAELENRLHLLETALMQRKAELAGRGIKVEMDSLLRGAGYGELNHADFHVVLPTEACKTEPGV